MSTATNYGNLIRNHGRTEPAGMTVLVEKMPVFWNWELVYTCNYRCAYCNYTALGWDGHEHMNVFPGLRRLEEVWTRIHNLYGECHIELSGGECTTYPRFYELLKMLTDRHTVTLDSNLSMDVERFVSHADLSKVRISASFHPEFADFETFRAKAVRLKQKGIDQIFVNYVAYPDQLEKMAHYKRELKKEGISVFIQPFQGVYKRGLPYPDNYSERDRRFIEEALGDGGPDSDISRVRFAWKGSTMRSGTENQLRKIDDESRSGQSVSGKHRRWSPFPWLFGNRDRSTEHPAAQNRVSMEPTLPEPAAGSQEERGASKRQPVLCRMGQKYAKVYAQGDTFRCCAQLRDDMPAELFRQKIYLGNLFYDDDLKLLEQPAWCDYEPCPCDRCMVVGEEARWKDRWHAPKEPAWRG
jgi:MoaA/NifB/PqqE/SkfB family radical SAM enzyme